jgi:hypothetical protein
MNTSPIASNNKVFTFIPDNLKVCVGSLRVKEKKIFPRAAGGITWRNRMSTIERQYLDLISDVPPVHAVLMI